MMAGIAISGLSGCGTTTATNRICGLLGIPRWNFTLRDLAAEMGLTLAQLKQKALSDETIDLEIDRRQLFFISKAERFVIGSRLAVWLDDPRIAKKVGYENGKPRIGLKIWLSAPFKVRCRRVFEREGGNLEEVTDFVRRRDLENAERYRKIYGIDANAPPAGAVVVDTEGNDAARVSEIIMSLAKGKL